MTDTPTDVAELVERLRKLVAEATPAPWELDTEYDPDALYSGGGGCGSGFKNYFIGAQVADGTEHGRWATLFDSVNSDHKLVEEEYDEDGKSAWDETARRNAETVVALVNAAPTLFDTITRLLADNARLTAERDALTGYRAAIQWVAADSWDGCSDCIEILKAAAAADLGYGMTPDDHANALAGLRRHSTLNRSADDAK